MSTPANTAPLRPCDATSMDDHHIPPDYLRCLPIELHSEAEAFIRYLRELPRKLPVECPQCGHPRFRVEANSKPRIPSYRCAACNKGFNCLTKSPFSGFGLMHLWPAYGQYLLAGWSIHNAAKALGVAPSTTSRWIKPLRAVMTKEFPALYHWWSARHDRTNLEPPPHIAAQAQAFLNGLEHLLTTQQADCPRCGSRDTQRVDEQRPNFYCSVCSSTLSLLRDTVLARLGYPEHWLGFAQGVINGETVVDLQRRTGLCVPACKRWQVRFLQMLEQQGHDDLIQWITWLRSRRVKEVGDFVREGGHMEAVTGSRYSGDSKRRFSVPPHLLRKQH